MNSVVIFGAGNIGRSFIGNIFASNGWEVTFIDANKNLVELLNRRGGYRVIIKRNGKPDETVNISGISAIHSSDKEAVLEKLGACSICATSVGQGALPFVVPVIAEAVKKRGAEDSPPLDVIIAENIRSGGDYFRKIFADAGLDENAAGLVETSIGKMVPIMTAEDLADDSLVLHAEEYNTLILDGRGFLGKVPDFPEIKAVDNITAWVDRKLFIHNLGHAAAAYLGFESNPELKLIAEAVEDSVISEGVRGAMSEAAAALLKEYPADFTAAALDEHIDDLVFRFGNRALGDTVFRVGRDLGRKLSRDDRILGAAALCLKHGLPKENILGVFKAALGFKAVGEDGEMFAGDIEFHARLREAGALAVIENRLGLRPGDGELARQLAGIAGS